MSLPTVTAAEGHQTEGRHTMSNDLTTRRRVPGPDDAAHDDGLLMHDLTVVNTMIGRYVLRFLDADAGHAEPIPVADEHNLADRLTDAAEAIRARADRRDRDERP
jgi:hypothetical protein